MGEPVFPNSAVDELGKAQEQVRNLTVALATSRRIGMAIGILMASCKLTEDQAFDQLVSVSQSTHEKLRDIADRVVLTGSVSDGPSD